MGTPDIIYEDEDMMVCRKPAGLAVQNVSSRKKDLESILKNKLALESGRGNPYLGIVHRLDQPVEGLILFGKNQKAAASLSAQIQDGRMKKYYLAVTDGIPEKKEDVLVHYLKKDGRTNTSKAAPAGTPGAKKACLFYKVLQETEGKALLQITLYTGRHHQIRVQTAAMGIPLWGDAKYNPRFQEGSGANALWQEEAAGRRWETGIGLCAYRLEFVHPRTGEKKIFTCQPAGEVFKLFSLHFIEDKGAY